MKRKQKQKTKYFWVDNENQKLLGYKDKMSFYNSIKWRNLRLQRLAENPLCQKCEVEDVITPATQVDHIIPIIDNSSLALDYNNTQSLCDKCHHKKTGEENQKRFINKTKGGGIVGKWM